MTRPSCRTAAYLALATAGGAVPISPASAAGEPGTWGPTRSQRLPSSSDALRGAFSARGGGFLVWYRFVGRGDLDKSQVGVLSRSGRLGHPFVLPNRVGVVADTADRDGRALTIAYPSRDHQTIGVGVLSPDARISDRQQLSAPHLFGTYQLAAAASGRALVVWNERASGTSRIRFATRRPGGRFSAASTLGSPLAYAMDATVTDSGRWLVAGVVRSAADRSTSRLVAWTGQVGQPRRHRFDLGPAPYRSEPETAIDGSGRAFVAWRTQQPDSGWITRAASVDPDDRGTTAPQTFGVGQDRGGQVQLVASPTGGATATVVDADGDSHLSVASAAGTFGPLLAPNGDRQGPTVYRSDGTAITTWGSNAENKTYAATLVGGVLGLPEDTGLPAGSLAAERTADGGLRLFTIEIRGQVSRLLSSLRRET